MMKIAIPQWQGRVSPVFDVAANLLIVEVVEGRQTGRQAVSPLAMDPLARARQVAQLQANVLICGAISWPLEMALSSEGVRVISHICGGVEEVLKAFVEGRLSTEEFSMPGCCGRRRRMRHGRGGPRERREA